MDVVLDHQSETGRGPGERVPPAVVLHVVLVPQEPGYPGQRDGGRGAPSDPVGPPGKVGRAPPQDVDENVPVARLDHAQHLRRGLAALGERLDGPGQVAAREGARDVGRRPEKGDVDLVRPY